MFLLLFSHFRKSFDGLEERAGAVVVNDDVVEAGLYFVF
jgi:hypothetical protein